jgi:Zn-dependent peptidase ImmA (M78 family)
VIALGTDALPFLLAHELGHCVLGHGCAERLDFEMAANTF